jgi:putative ABC transport system permease protein
MDVKNIVKNSFSIMLHTKLRTGLTMLGIVIGISSVIIVSSVGKGQLKILNEVNENLTQNKYDILVDKYFENYKITDATYLTQKELNLLSDNPNIEGISVNEYIWSGSVRFLDAPHIKPKPNKTLISYNLSTRGYLRANNLKLLYGRNFSNFEDRNYAIIDDKLAEDIFKTKNAVGEELRLLNRGTPINLNIAGVINNPYFLADKIQDDTVSRYIILVPYLYAKKNRLQQRKIIPSYTVRFKNSVNANVALPQLLNEISTMKETPEGVYIAEPAKSSFSGTESTIKKLNVFVFIVSVIALFVGGIGIMDIMLVTINERTDEIGLRKAIGAKNRDIMFQFLIESVILTFTGGIIGIGIGLIGCVVAGSICYIPPIIDWTMLIISTLVSIVIGIIFGLYPAYKAAKMNPIDALKEME